MTVSPPLLPRVAVPGVLLMLLAGTPPEARAGVVTPARPASAGPVAASRPAVPRTPTPACPVAVGTRLRSGPPDGTDETAKGPREVIQETVDEVSAALSDPSLTNRELRERIMSVVDRKADMERLSKLVLRRAWTSLSDDEWADFQDVFKRHLMFTYYRNAKAARFDRIVVTGDRQEARGEWTVETRVVGTAGGDTSVDYRLRKWEQEGAPDEWKIIDIIVDNVSLMLNFRAQFKEILARSSPQKLLADLRKKVAEAEREAAEDDEEAARADEGDGVDEGVNEGDGEVGGSSGDPGGTKGGDAKGGDAKGGGTKGGGTKGGGTED